MKIIDRPLSDGQFFKERFTKKQIYLHHTVSPSDSIEGDFSWWQQTPDRVATAYIIRGDGQIFSLFDDRFWAHHLGLRTSNNTALNRGSIGIEIDSAGQLRYDKGQYISSFGRVIKPENVAYYEKPFRGFNYYEKYTAAQIASLKELLISLSQRYGINLKYSDKIWDINQDALNGVNGLYTHVSVRRDKSDCHPQPELIEMLKNI